MKAYGKAVREKTKATENTTENENEIHDFRVDNAGVAFA